MLTFTDTGPATRKPALVMLHGVGGGKASWVDVSKAAQHGGFRAIAVELPMYGASPAVAPYTLENAARAVHRTLSQLGIDEAIWVGHSMGGMVAQEAAAHLPQAVAGLVLAGTSPAFGKPGGDWQKQFLASRFAPLDAGQTMADLAKVLVPKMMAPNASTVARDTAIAMMSRVPEATYRLALTALATFNQRDNLPNIKVPTLCIAGEFDTNAAPQVVETMAKHIDGARYHLMSDVGHLMMLEQPQAFSDVMLAFLEQVFPR
jgi:3-oxoadipate enol-lactonase